MHAQHIYRAAHDSAVSEYGEGERAHRIAFAAVKHEYKKVGDRWAPRAERKAVVASGSRAISSREGPTRAELYERAKRLDIPGRSKMTKDALAQAVKRKRG